MANVLRSFLLVFMLIIVHQFDNFNKNYIRFNTPKEASITYSELEECKESEVNIIIKHWECTPRDDGKITLRKIENVDEL